MPINFILLYKLYIVISLFTMYLIYLLINLINNITILIINIKNKLTNINNGAILTASKSTMIFLTVFTGICYLILWFQYLNYTVLIF